MYTRMNMLAGDPALLGEVTRYIAGTVRPHVEGQHGNRGLACATNADLGVCVVTSYWDSQDAMTASEQAVQVSRKEVAERLHASVTVEQYEVPVFVRRSRPAEGAGVRVARIDCAPANIDALIEEFRNTAVPGLMEQSGLCSTQLMADRVSGRCVVSTVWEDKAALVASRPATARMRADASGITHFQVRAIEEYSLAFSSVREGDTRSLIERDTAVWNAADREGWLAGFDMHRLDVQMPGSPPLTGREAAETFWSTWQGAFPGNQLETISIHADDRGGVHEAYASGTHSGSLRGPAGEIPATGKAVRLRICVVYAFEEGKITSHHLYFDQAELLRQLGLGADR